MRKLAHNERLFRSLGLSPNDSERTVERKLRAIAASAQADELCRLARDYALFRPGTRPEEITPARIREVASVVAKLRRLLKELEARQRRRGPRIREKV